MRRPPSKISRRRAIQALGIAGATAVAGCVTPGLEADSCSDGHALSLTEASTTHVSNEFSTPVDGLGHATEAVAGDAIESGRATSRGYYAPTFHAQYVVVGPGTGYYRVETTERDPATVPGFEYSVEIGVEEPGSGDEVHAFPELFPEDRESIRDALGNDHLLDAPHYDSFAVVFAFEAEDARERSAFVPGEGPQFVEWDDHLLRFTFEERRPVRVATTVVTTDLVAESPEKFVEYVGETSGVVLDDLTGEQRDVVERAIEDDDGCVPDSPAVQDLLDRLSTGDEGNARLARYEGTWYFVDVD